METKKALLLDDDIAICSLLTLALQEAGYEVHFQSSLIGLTDVIETFAPNIIILDVEIGDRNSIDTLPEIKSITESTPIIFISSHTQSDFIVRAIEGGGTHYLKKPFDTDELLVYADKLCKSNQLSRELYFGRTKLSIRTRTITFTESDNPHRLGKKEFEILRLLALNFNSYVSREQILSIVSLGETSYEHSLNNMIFRLRGYISPDKTIAIKTLHTHGYKLFELE